ncbi:hypothetical protein B0919_18650 [Hymenobacter sp. CRA2]|nr:hypothetical protein B0919_18650 [Hymenobacter sp. CRA2]
MVSEVKQTEVSAGIDQNGFGYARASAAPLKHLLLTGTASGRFWGPAQLRPQRNDERNQHQWEAGLGTFTQLSPNTTIGLLGGYGQGRSEYQRFQSSLLSSIWGNTSREYRRYETATSHWYGQAYLVTNLTPLTAAVQFRLGAAYRLSLVNYRQFSNQQYLYYPDNTSYVQDAAHYEVPNVLWHSVSSTAEVRLKSWPAVGLQASLGAAVPQRTSQADNADQSGYRSEVSGRSTWGHTSIGVTLNPHYLLRRKAQ